MRALNAKLSNHTLYVRTLNCFTPKEPSVEVERSVAADIDVTDASVVSVVETEEDTVFFPVTTSE
jgi:hypothetical protein